MTRSGPHRHTRPYRPLLRDGLRGLPSPGLRRLYLLPGGRSGRDGLPAEDRRSHRRGNGLRPGGVTGSELRLRGVVESRAQSPTLNSGPFLGGRYEKGLGPLHRKCLPVPHEVGGPWTGHPCPTFRWSSDSGGASGDKCGGTRSPPVSLTVSY